MNDLNELKQEFLERVKLIASKANEYKESLDRYSYLWIEDRKESMRQFLLYNHILTQDEFNEIHTVVESPPTLDHFKQKVNGVLFENMSTHKFFNQN